MFTWQNLEKVKHFQRIINVNVGEPFWECFMWMYLRKEVSSAGWGCIFSYIIGASCRMKMLEVSFRVKNWFIVIGFKDTSFNFCMSSSDLFQCCNIIVHSHDFNLPVDIYQVFIIYDLFFSFTCCQIFYLYFLILCTYQCLMH